MAQDNAPRTTHHALSAVKDGLIRLAVAYTGSYEKDGQEFSISPNDLRQMMNNLHDREIPLDYEHMSGMPVPPGWSKASGWLKKFDGIEEFSDGRQILYGWAELTPACLAAVRQKEFRYFSPEIHWNEKDEQGRKIGTRLAAGAITNRPFLKDLPPIEISAVDYPQLLESVALSESRRLFDLQSVHVAAPVNSETSRPGAGATNQSRKQPAQARRVGQARREGTATEKENAMKTFNFRKLTDGEHKGKVGIFDGDEMLGLAHMPSMKNCLDDADDSATQDETQFTELRSQVASYEAAAHARAQVASETQALTEIAQDGRLDLARAEALSSEGRLSMAGFLRAQRIERMIESAVKSGKVLPKQRAALFTLALSDTHAAEQFIQEARPVVDLRTYGVSGEGAAAGGATQELEQAVAAYMTEHKDANGRSCDRIVAMREVTRRNPELWERHKRESAVRVEQVQ